MKTRILSKVIQEPRVLIGRLKGFHSNQCFYNLVARRLVNQEFKTIIDVGANYGLFIRPARWVNPNAKVYAFEPVPSAYDLIKNMRNVEAYNFGLSDKEGTFDFYYNKKSEGSSSFLKPTKDYKEISGGEILKRKAFLKRFDPLKLKIKKPCFLKIDTEGFEYFVLKSFGRRLKEVDVVQVEYHFKNYFKGRGKLSQIISLLEKYGFTGMIQTEYHKKGCDLMFYRK